VWNEQE